MAANPDANLGFQNFFQATLTGDITASSTDILMDNIPNSSQGFLVIEPDSTTNREVIFYTSKTALKVVCPSAADGRGQDDTTAVAHSTGAVVIMSPVAAFFEALQSGQSLSDDSIASRHVVGFDKSNLTTDSNPYKFRARRTTAQNSGSGTFAIINFNTEDYDTNSNFDISTNVGRYTAPIDGFYHFGARFSASVTGAGQLLLALYKNGSAYQRGVHLITSAGTMGVSLSTELQATAGDYFEIYSFGTGGALETGTSTDPVFYGHLISRT